MTWQAALKNGLTQPATLASHTALSKTDLERRDSLNTGFPFKMPSDFASYLTSADLNDPVLKQFLPDSLEIQAVPGYIKDPLAESTQNPIPGVLHKYHGRVLFIVTGQCAIHCRYCFRRHFPYQNNNPGKRGWQKALDYIRQDTSIEEVILSGGDPLVATDASLQFLIDQLNTIPHLTTLRIHTRIPTVLPERITPALVACLQKSRYPWVMVIHCNHPQELTPPAQNALQQLHRAGMTLLNQSVLLKGVNDHAETLISLSKTLFCHHTLPYYLHLLDPVSGAAHFAVSEEAARILMNQISAALPGYLVPKLVRETAGARHKIVLGE